jgi:hypothetical protein
VWRRAIAAAPLVGMVPGRRINPAFSQEMQGLEAMSAPKFAGRFTRIEGRDFDTSRGRADLVHGGAVAFPATTTKPLPREREGCQLCLFYALMVMVISALSRFGRDDRCEKRRYDQCETYEFLHRLFLLK